MALKYKYDSQEEIPAEMRAHYVEREGKWCLDGEFCEKAKLDEFRTNNIALARERDALKARFDGIDPEAVRKLAEDKRKLEEEAQLKAGEFDKVLASRLQSAKGEYEKQLAAANGERDALHKRLTEIQIDQAVVTEATKRGLRPTAIPDITARARYNFKLVNGVPQAFEADGQTVRVGRDGATPLTLAEWIDTQVAEAPHLFESNAGGGGGGAISQYAGGSGSQYGSGGAATVNRTVRNPWKKETWNLTEQMRVQKSDPGLAARMKAAA